MSFAVIKTGGKQYKVAEGDVISVEKLKQDLGTEFNFEEVLLYGNQEAEHTKIGTPFIPGAKVTAKVLAQEKDKKKIVFKYSNKTRYRKKKGHRQSHTKVQIIKISL